MYATNLMSRASNIHKALMSSLHFFHFLSVRNSLSTATYASENNLIFMFLRFTAIFLAAILLAQGVTLWCQVQAGRIPCISEWHYEKMELPRSPHLRSNFAAEPQPCLCKRFLSIIFLSFPPPRWLSSLLIDAPSSDTGDGGRGRGNSHHIQ